MKIDLIPGDCLEKLKELDEGSIDLIVTDPPYGYSFMGKDWDKAVPSVEIWKECLRVLKPGAFCLVMSAPSTYTIHTRSPRGFPGLYLWRRGVISAPNHNHNPR